MLALSLRELQPRVNFVSNYKPVIQTKGCRYWSLWWDWPIEKARLKMSKNFF